VLKLLAVVGLGLGLSSVCLAKPGGHWVTAPGGAYGFSLPGAAGDWRQEAADPGVTRWVPAGQDNPFGMVVVASTLLVPADMPADRVLAMVRTMVHSFVEAADIEQPKFEVMGAVRPMLTFTFTGPATTMAARVVAIAAGGAVSLLTIQSFDDKDAQEAAEEVLLSIGPARGGAAAPGAGGAGAAAAGAANAPALGLGLSRQAAKALPGLPAGWVATVAPDGTGVQAWEAAADGAALELQVVPWQGGSAALLHDGFYARQTGLVVDKVLRAPDDRFAQLMYHGAGGAPRRGEAVVSMGPGGALFCRFTAPVGTYLAKRAAVDKLLASLTGGAPAGGPQQPVPPLTRAANGDGTAWASVPAGWQAGGSNGILLAKSATGGAALGMHSLVWTVAAGQEFVRFGQPLPPLVSDYLPPERALPYLITALGQVTHEPVTDFKMVAAQPLPQAPGFALVQADYTQARTGEAARAWTVTGLVSSAPVDDKRWAFYFSLVNGTRERFAQDLPTLMAVFNSYGVSAALQAERWRQIQNSQTEITRIIQDVTANRARASEVGSAKWDAYLRGTTPTINRNTGEARQLGGLDDLARWRQEQPNADLQPMGLEDWHHARW
jgi:hypothetical protein